MDNKPKLLFRYRPSTQYAVEAVLEKKTFATCPIQLNDALDSSIVFDSIDLTNKLMKSKKMRVRFRDRLFLTLDRKMEEFSSFEEYAADLKNAQESAERKLADPKSLPVIQNYVSFLALDMIKEFRRSFAVVSFCSEGQSQIMWSHYSSDSSGFVLAYIFENLTCSLQKWVNERYSRYSDTQRSIFGLHKVTYCESFVGGTEYIYKCIMKRREVNSTRESFLKSISTQEDANFVLSLLTEKRKEWSYEGEYRLIIPFDDVYCDEEMFNELNDCTGNSNHNVYYTNIGNLQPDAIYFGEKTTLVNMVALASFCKAYDIPLFRQNLLSLQRTGNMNISQVDPEDVIRIKIRKDIH